MPNRFLLADAAIPHAFYAPENQSLFTGILRGIEKECLRVDADGVLALSPHPAELGSALTHPQITTDFSEALLEFITPPTHRIDTLLLQLKNLHRFTYRHLPREEMLWNNSMPCMLGNSDSIPVAQYGTTNRGRMKTVYRVGLGHRYGRVMQTVAGLHFNFSLPNAFWAFMHQNENSPEELDRYRTNRYFALIRNFRRHYWLLIYLFGASPALCRSFVQGRDHNLEIFGDDEHTLHRPFATSLRMGDLGYQSSAQEALYVCYNSRESYVNTLGAAISTPYQPYQQLGVKSSNGEYIQLNTSLLQIENEFYSAIRPKRTAQKGETALTALCRRGVEYIEVRCLDLDPYSDIGVSEEQLLFLDCFLVYCALQDSPDCDAEEFKRILHNQKQVVNEGRRAGLQLITPNADKMSLSNWGEQLLEALEPVAQLLDHCHNSEAYQLSLSAQKNKIRDPNLTPSARVLNDLKSQGISFAQWAKTRADAQKDRFLQQTLSSTAAKKYQDMAEESSAIQKAEEEHPQIPFDEYLKHYYEQYRACCASQL